MAKVVNPLSPTQRAKVLQIPDDFSDREIVRYYSLSPDDLDVIAEHRRPHNRLGFSVQLTYLRYPGRAWNPEEQIPPNILTYLARQVDEPPDPQTQLSQTNERERIRYVETLAGPEDAWISITDAARITPTSEAMARRWVTSGRLPIKREPVGVNQRTRLVRVSDVATIRPVIDPLAAISDEVHKLDLPSESPSKVIGNVIPRLIHFYGGSEASGYHISCS